MRKILLVSILFTIFGSAATAQTSKTKKETATAKKETSTLKKLPSTNDAKSVEEANAAAAKADELKKQKEEAHKSAEVPVPALIRKSN